MKAEELRIGNLIFNEDFGIEIVTISTLVDIASKTTDQYKPIVTNKELLLRYGFDTNKNKTSKHYLFYHQSNRQFDRFKIVCWGDGNTRCVINGVVIDLPYFHQLQNLFFCVTGKELTVRY